jgi:hypothetical protein
MAELAKKLNLKKNGVQQTAKAYSTTAEVGEHWVNAKIDGVPAYVAIGDIADSRATSGRVKGSGGDSYAILNSGKPPYNKVEYITPGTYTITFPPDITTAKITSAGGGGGGGGGFAQTYLGGAIIGKNTGGTGGRGALISKKITVTEGKTYAAIVGAGGAGGASLTANGGTASNGNSGGQSSFGDIVFADGGGGGYGASNNGNGSAGASYGSGGTGGNGGYGTSNGSSGSPGWVIIEYGGDI